MKLYKTRALTAEGWTEKWDGTQDNARARRKEFKVQSFEKIETTEVDVPTDKQGLLGWLNAHCDTGE